MKRLRLRPRLSTMLVWLGLYAQQVGCTDPFPLWTWNLQLMLTFVGHHLKPWIFVLNSHTKVYPYSTISHIPRNRPKRARTPKASEKLWSAFTSNGKIMIKVLLYCKCVSLWSCKHNQPFNSMSFKASIIFSIPIAARFDHSGSYPDASVILSEIQMLPSHGAPSLWLRRSRWHGIAHLPSRTQWTCSFGT